MEDSTPGRERKQNRPGKDSNLELGIDGQAESIEVKKLFRLFGMRTGDVCASCPVMNETKKHLFPG